MARTRKPKDQSKVAFVVRLPAELHHRVKRLAAREDLSLNQLVKGALRRLLDQRKET